MYLYYRSTSLSASLNHVQILRYGKTRTAGTKRTSDHLEFVQEVSISILRKEITQISALVNLGFGGSRVRFLLTTQIPSFLGTQSNVMPGPILGGGDRSSASAARMIDEFNIEFRLHTPDELSLTIRSTRAVNGSKTARLWLFGALPVLCLIFSEQIDPMDNLPASSIRDHHYHRSEDGLQAPYLLDLSQFPFLATF